MRADGVVLAIAPYEVPERVEAISLLLPKPLHGTGSQALCVAVLTRRVSRRFGHVQPEVFRCLAAASAPSNPAFGPPALFTRPRLRDESEQPGCVAPFSGMVAMAKDDTR